jgi:predicted cupin superfamily sugar epimerase
MSKMTEKSAAYYIEKLQLNAHVEGGAFKETYRSALKIAHKYLPPDFKGKRNVSTAIYFLLKEGQFSAMHKIASDELWHFYAGSPLYIYELNAAGELITHILGNDLEAGQSFQVLIPAGSWFGSRCQTPGAFSLAGCTVAPGFDFEDFELANKQFMKDNFPAHAQLWDEMCI